MILFMRFQLLKEQGQTDLNKLLKKNYTNFRRLNYDKPQIKINVINNRHNIIFYLI